MLAATLAMTVVGLEERRIHFKAHPAAKTATTDCFTHPASYISAGIVARWPVSGRKKGLLSKPDANLAMD